MTSFENCQEILKNSGSLDLKEFVYKLWQPW